MEYVRKDKYTKPYTPSDILKLALKKETSSFEFYQAMLRDTKNIALVSVLQKLKKSEEGHIKIIQRMLDR